MDNKNNNTYDETPFDPNLQFDAFTSGIEAGGLRAKSAISSMVCYVIANTRQNVTIKILTEAMMEGKIANYFEVCDSIDKLKAKKLIFEDENGVLTISNQARKYTELIENDLPLNIRSESIELCQKLVAKEAYKKENKVDIEKDENGYKVTMHVSDKISDFMVLTLYVPTETQAVVIKEGFLENPVKIYENLIDTIFDENK